MKRVVAILALALFALSASAQELNVGEFNIRNGRSLREGEARHTKGDYSKFNGWDDRKQHLCDMINFEAFDVFGAQEVRHGQLEYMQEQLPDYKYVGVARDDGAEKGEYCPVFYRKKEFKLLDSGTFWLSETPDEPSKGWDGMCNRICTWAHLERKSDRCRLYFLSVHFDHRGHIAKMEGSKQVVAWVKEHCGDENVIVVGDFNYEPDKEYYKVFSESGVLVDVYDIVKYRFFPTGSFSAFDPRRYTTNRGDHIFVSNGIEASRYATLTYHYYRDMNAKEEAMDTLAPKEIKGENRDVKMLSDHYPVQAFVTLKKSEKSKK